VDTSRIVAHLDMDAFYVSVELLRRPDLRGKPVIVAGSGPRAVVTTASYEARKFGVGSAMPASRARRLCPDGVYLRPDFPYYRDTSRRIMAIIADLGVPYEPVSLDEAYIELTGLPYPVDTMTGVVRRIREELSLDASVGIGPNKLVAKVASDAEKPRGFVMLSRERAMARFADEPPRLIPGIGPKTAERLERLGVTTIAGLRELELDLLIERFGEHSGHSLFNRARFIDNAPVAVRERKSRSVENTFDRDLRGLPAMEEVLAGQAEKLAADLLKRDLRARNIAIKVRHDDFTTVTRAKTLPDPTDDAAVIAATAVELLRAYNPARPVRLLGVRAGEFDREGARRPPAGVQLRLDDLDEMD